MSTVREIKVGNVNYNAGRVHYGTCKTAAATVAKVVSCPTFTADDLVAGAAIIVKNTTTNTGAAGSLTLNVNNTGGKSIKRLNNGAIENIASAEFFASTLFFVYDGTYWLLSGSNYNTTTDTKVTQTAVTTGTYPLLLTNTAEQTTTVTDTTKFSTSFQIRTDNIRTMSISGNPSNEAGYWAENIGIEKTKPGAKIGMVVGTAMANYGLYSTKVTDSYMAPPSGWLIRANSTESVLTAHLPATSIEGKLIGKAGAVTAGNYTTTMPTTTGAVTGQIMFLLV